MGKKKGAIPEQFESELREKFIRVKPDDDFIKTLSDALFSGNHIALEYGKKFLYYVALFLFSLFSGLLVWSIIKYIFFPAHHSTSKD